MSSALMSSYQRLPVAFVRGEGVWLWDTEGRRYLDAVGGIAVCALGHAHPAVAQAVAEQAAILVHTSNLYRIAERVVRLLPPLILSDAEALVLVERLGNVIRAFLGGDGS